MNFQVLSHSARVDHVTPDQLSLVDDAHRPSKPYSRYSQPLRSANVSHI